MPRIEVLNFSGGGSGYEILDTDRDTGIKVEETLDEDVIHFDLGDSISPIEDALTMSIDDGFRFNSGYDNIDFTYFDTAGDPLLFLDASGAACSIGTVDTSYRYGRPTSSYLLYPKLLVQTPDSGSVTSSLFRRYSNTSTRGGTITFARGRTDGLSPAGPLVVINEDTIGGLQYLGYNGTLWAGNTTILGRVDATLPISSTSMPINLEFYLGDNISVYKSMLLRANGQVGIRRSYVTTDVEIDGNIVFNQVGTASYLFRVESASNQNLFRIDSTTSTVRIGSISIGDLASFEPTQIIFNELGANIDFRMESDLWTNMFLIDASDNSVQIGNATAGAIAKFTANLVSINEYKDGIDFKVEGNNADTLFFIDVSTDTIDIGTITDHSVANFSSSEIHFNKDSEDINFLVSSVVWTSMFLVDASNDSVQIGNTTAGAIAYFGNSSIVFNELGTDMDFRVEGDFNSQMFLVDASNDSVQIGNTTAGAIAYFGNYSIVFNELGMSIDFRVESDLNSQMFFVDADDNSVQIGNATAGAIAYFGNSSIVLNEEGNDVDFRIETDGDQLTFFVDGGTNTIGIGTNSPESMLEIEGIQDAISDLNDLADYHLSLRNLANATGDGIGIGFSNSSTDGNVGAAIIHKRTGSFSQGDLEFYVKTSTSSAVNPILVQRYTEEGHFEFGTSTNSSGLFIRKSVEVTTSDATVTTIDSITLDDNTVYHAKARVTGIKNDYSQRASYEFDVTAYRAGGNAIIQGTVTSLHSQESDATWDAIFTVNGNDLRVSVTGVVATTIRWTCILEYTNNG